ncbi:hypothetical protein AY599_09665 [Leptolyngbya valderiana BDU 20041]|nr:DUF3598 family protein [Geitlerinema sp. CS-897]OAB63645.1 hypothetical protein AY599_09665 [Leptolyngbya valderiana BDU 20041]
MTETLQLQDFNLFPKHVGIWEGTWTICDGEGNKLQQFTAVLEQRIVDNEWRQTNHQTYADGSTEVQEFVGRAIGHGELEVSSKTPPFSNYKTLAKELDDRLILFKIWEKETNALRAIELIHLVSEGYRVRTTQSFTSEGELQGIMTIVETKR